MYDDLLGPNKKTPQKAKRVFWDIDEYLEAAYCYNCGSHAVSVIRDQLHSNYMEKDVRCDTCGCEWQEIWDKDIDLTLRELRMKCMMIC